MTSDFRTKYGPWALVTGASSGIGEQFARELAGEGLDLLLVARRAAQLTSIAAELEQACGIRVETVALDLTALDFVAPLLAACEGKDIGLVVSNAGAGAKGALHETETAKLTAIVDLNCRAPLLLARTFVPALIERGRGGFILTASIEGYAAFPFSATYAASKAFDRSFGEALWSELRDYGVDVLVLSPGPTDTDILPGQGMDPGSMIGLMRPRDVARGALDHLDRGPTYIPGIFNRSMVGLLGLLPSKLGLAAARFGMRTAIEAGRKKS